MTIEVMKQALEALETCMYPQQKQIQAITSLRQAIEQAEKQEPVCDTDPRGCWSVRCQLGNKCKNTPAPQRKWVGLTDEEIALVCSECAASAHNWNDISFARAIEAKLKERNHG